MLAMQTVPSELVLQVNERASFRRRAPPRFARRAMGRKLSVVAARLERSVGFQSSLRRVLEADEEFQRTLDQAQRTRWLTLEDALLDHAWRAHRAFFRAGLETGWRAAMKSTGNERSPPAARRARALGERSEDEMELVSSLLDIIRKLVER